MAGQRYGARWFNQQLGEIRLAADQLFQSFLAFEVSRVSFAHEHGCQTVLKLEAEGTSYEGVFAGFELSLPGTVNDQPVAPPLRLIYDLYRAEAEGHCCSYTKLQLPVCPKVKIIEARAHTKPQTPRPLDKIKQAVDALSSSFEHYQELYAELLLQVTGFNRALGDREVALTFPQGDGRHNGFSRGRRLWVEFRIAPQTGWTAPIPIAHLYDRTSSYELGEITVSIPPAK